AADGPPPQSYCNEQRLDRVELIGDVVVDVPEIADIGGADERVGMAVMTPVEQIDVVAAREGRREIRLRRGADHHRQRPERLVVGGVVELRRLMPFDADDARALEGEAP